MPWETLLHTAAREGKLALVKSLLSQENINLTSTWGYSPLNCACYGGHIEIVQLLIQAGADVASDNGEGWTPLHAACLKGHAAVVKLLLENGAGVCVNTSSGNYHTPLYVACKSTCDPKGVIVSLLLEAGADVNVRNPLGKTPLIEAVSKGSIEKVEMLLKAGAEVNSDCGQPSPLHFAGPYPKIITLLIQHGADVNLADWRGEIPIQKKNIFIASFMLLLEAGSGGSVPCQKHKRCNGSILMCLYKSGRLKTTKGQSNVYYPCIERYFTKLEVAGLHPGKGNAPLDPPLEFAYWSDSIRGAYIRRCQKELAKMKEEKVDETGATFLDVLYQRPIALRQVNTLKWEDCERTFPMYGWLIYIKFRDGQRRYPLIEESLNFFTLTSLPRLPMECAAEIFSYLPEEDLRNIVSICASHSNCSIPQPQKRCCDEPSFQAMKNLKMS